LRQYFRFDVAPIFSVRRCAYIFGSPLRQYFRFDVAPIFSVRRCVNIFGSTLRLYFRFDVASIFAVKHRVNISGSTLRLIVVTTMRRIDAKHCDMKTQSIASFSLAESLYW